MIMYKYPSLVFLLFWIHYALLYVVYKNIDLNIYSVYVYVCMYIYIYIYIYICVCYVGINVLTNLYSFHRHQVMRRMALSIERTSTPLTLR